MTLRRFRSRLPITLLSTIALVGALLTAPTAALTGSTFDSANGSLTPSTGGHTDWNVSPPSLVRQADTASGGGDDAFGQGAKEDISNPTVVSGSIPPNKSDLTAFLAAHELAASGHQMLYLAWERSNVLGNANMDFEFNQNKCDAADASHSHCNANGVTPERMAGDILVTFDFVNGGDRPVLGLLAWQTTGTKAQCFSANSLPCWGMDATRDSLDGVTDHRIDLSDAGFADGAVNSTTVSDTTVSPTVVLPALTFGEAGIDLTNAGVFSTSSCTTYGSAFLKSRSSASFTAELKDFIAPATVSITNCGSVRIHKQDDTRAALSGVGFTLYADNAPTGGTRGAEDTATTFTCSTDTNGDCTISNVSFGTYWIVETGPPGGYTPGADQQVTVSATTPNPGIVTFVDAREPASVKVHKQDDLGNPLSGATFTLYADATPTGPPDGSGSRQDSHGTEDTSSGLTCTTDATGDCTITNVLPAGAYWVVETTVPSGYAAAADQWVDLSLGENADLTATPFVDPALFKVITIVCRQSDTSLYGAKVAYDGATLPASANTPTTMPTGVTAATLCGLSGTYVHGDVQRGSHTGAVSIP